MAEADQIVFVGTFWTNSDGLSLNEGDLVIRDNATVRGVKRTILPNHPDVVGVCLHGAPPLGTVRVATVVGQRVKVNIATGTAVAVGDLLVSSIDAGLANVDNSVGAVGVFAVATDVKPGGSGSNVECLIVALGAGSGSPGSASGSFIHERLLNGDGGALALGTVVRVGPENGTVHKMAGANPGNNVTGTVGVVEDASIAPGFTGNVITHGQCSVRMIGGLTLTIGQLLYLAENDLGTTAGMVTNAPPDGSSIIPLGILKNALNYLPGGGNGQLVIMDLQIDALPRTPTREVGGFHTSVGANFEDLLLIPLRLDTSYLVEVSVAAIGVGGSVGAFKRMVTAKNIAGVVTFDGGQSVVHVGTNAGYSVQVTGVLDVLHVQIQAAADVASAGTCRLTAARLVEEIPE